MKILLPVGIALVIGIAVYLVVRYLMSSRKDKEKPVIVNTTASNEET